MSSQVLILGGAGFIASHAADELLASGYRVRSLDSLDPQVHGAGRSRPDYLDDRVELIVGDIRDAAVVRRALRGVDSVLHLAAAAGGQLKVAELYTHRLGLDGLSEAFRLMNERPAGFLKAVILP